MDARQAPTRPIEWKQTNNRKNPNPLLVGRGISRFGQASTQWSVDEGPHEQPGHFWAGWAKRVTKRQGRRGAKERRQDVSYKYQALALTRLLLGIPWRPSRSVRSRRHTGGKLLVCTLPFHQSVPWAAREPLHQPMRLAWHPRPRLPSTCQDIRQCYCHERECVIKTERPAVLLN